VHTLKANIEPREKNSGIPISEYGVDLYRIEIDQFISQLKQTSIWQNLQSKATERIQGNKKSLRQMERTNKLISDKLDDKEAAVASAFKIKKNVIRAPSKITRVIEEIEKSCPVDGSFDSIATRIRKEDTSLVLEPIMPSQRAIGTFSPIATGSDWKSNKAESYRASHKFN